MSAEEILAQHQLGEDVLADTCYCGVTNLGNKEMGAHQVAVLKAAGYAIVDSTKKGRGCGCTVTSRWGES